MPWVVRIAWVWLPFMKKPRKCSKTTECICSIPCINLIQFDFPSEYLCASRRGKTWRNCWTLTISTSSQRSSCKLFKENILNVVSAFAGIGFVFSDVWVLIKETCFDIMAIALNRRALSIGSKSSTSLRSTPRNPPIHLAVWRYYGPEIVPEFDKLSRKYRQHAEWNFVNTTSTLLIIRHRGEKPIISNEHRWSGEVKAYVWNHIICCINND